MQDCCGHPRGVPLVVHGLVADAWGVAGHTTPDGTPIPAPVVLGVIGSAEVVAASLSPRMMAAAFADLGIRAQYVALAVQPGDAECALRALPLLGFAGCNVTMPFKHVAARVADTATAAVRAAGAANVLVVREGGSLHAETTDGPAVIEALQVRGVRLRGAEVTVLGAGGAGREVASAVATAGAARVRLWNRTPERAHQLAASLRASHPALEVEVCDDLPIQHATHVLVGCVPADALLEADLHLLPVGATVVDLAYRRDGRPTPLEDAVAGRPERWVGGREVLVRQGQASLRAWFGAAPSIEVMTRAVS